MVEGGIFFLFLKARYDIGPSVERASAKAWLARSMIRGRGV